MVGNCGPTGSIEREGRIGQVVGTDWTGAIENARVRVIKINTNRAL